MIISKISIAANVNAVNATNDACIADTDRSVNTTAVPVLLIGVLISAITLALVGCGDNGVGMGDGPVGGFLIKYNIEMEMAFVEGGTFRMGCTPEQPQIQCWGSERPVHSVTLSDFYIGKYEVTQRQWRVVMGGGADTSYNAGDNMPVESVSWNEVQEFIARLNAATGLRYRLPTEAEWEFAARGGVYSGDFIFAGSNDPDAVAWFGGPWNGGNNGNSESRTQPVGTKAPNELGLYDMSGNVWEFVNDWWDDFYTHGDKTDPQGPELGEYRVIRGGSVGSEHRESRVSNRYFCTPDSRFADVGFRLVMSVADYQ